MKVWELKPIDPESAPWRPWYDKCFGMLIAADSEQEARAIAVEHEGDETERGQPSVWLNPELTSCEELKATKPGLILRDFASA